MILKKRLMVCAVTVLAALSTLSPMTANASTAIQKADDDTSSLADTLTADQKAEITETFNQYGVPESTQTALIKKFEAGQPWDSMLTDKDPISVRTNKSATSVETVSTYRDGSIAIQTAPLFAESASTVRSISGCQYSRSGSTLRWKGCDANVNLVVISMGFVFDYQNTNHKNPKITGYRAYHYFVIGCSLGDFRFDRMSASSVRLSASLTVAFKGFPAGHTAWMQVNVNGDNASTTHN
jgi:hypothetical protein